MTAALGVPLAFTLLLTSFTYLLSHRRHRSSHPANQDSSAASTRSSCSRFRSSSWAARLMESAGISERIVDLAMAIVGRIRGGLAMVTVVAEIIFSGISGSTAADVSAISSMLVPSMKKAGYSGPESVSVVAAASAMGILVPPCLTMVVLGSLVNLSIVTLFLAGFVPAFVLAAVAPRADRRSAPGARTGRSPSRPAHGAPRPRAPPRDRAARSAGAALRRHLLGRDDGHRSRAAGRGLCARRRVRAPATCARCRLASASPKAASSTATTLWVLAAASAFAWILVREWVPQALGEWIAGSGTGPVGFMALTILVFVVIGALLEGLPALLIFGPILFPISRSVGIDPVHYGIVIVAAMGIAFFLPPIGVGLTIAAGIGRVDHRRGRAARTCRT